MLENRPWKKRRRSRKVAGALLLKLMVSMSAALSPRRGWKAPGAQQHALDTPYVHLGSLDLVIGLAPCRTIQVVAPPAKGLGWIRQRVQVPAELVEHIFGLGKVFGLRNHFGSEASYRHADSGEAVGLVLGCFRGREMLGCVRVVAVVGIVGELDGRGWRRGLHAYVSVEEFGRVVVATSIVILVNLGQLVVFVDAAGVVCRGYFGDGVLELFDKLREIFVGVFMEVDACFGEGADHGADYVLGRAVDERGEAGDDAEGVEEAGGGD